MATFGLSTDIDPVEALAGELARVNGSCAWLSDRVQAQDPDALLTTESGRALLDQYRAERDRLVRVSKACIDADIGQRTVRLKEQTTDLINAVLIASLTDLGHDPSDPRVRRIIAKHLGAAAGNPVLELLPGGRQ